MSRGILRVVQVLQHRRMGQSCEDQVAEAAESMRSDGVLRVIANQPRIVGLVLEYAEVIQPEPHQLLLQLGGRVNASQQFAASRLVGQTVALLVERLPVGLLDAFIRQRVDALLLRAERRQKLGCRDP